MLRDGTFRPFARFAAGLSRQLGHLHQHMALNRKVLCQMSLSPMQDRKEGITRDTRGIHEGYTRDHEAQISDTGLVKLRTFPNIAINITITLR